jgi:hypothetical protein
MKDYPYKKKKLYSIFFVFIRSSYSNLEGDELEMRKFLVRKWMLERICTGIQYER